MTPEKEQGPRHFESIRGSVGVLMSDSPPKLDGDEIRAWPEERLSFPLGLEPSSVRSMLIIHQGALGDFILALPALEVLRKAFPHGRSAFMGFPRILELVENRFYADEILSIDQKGMAPFFVQEGSLDPSLSRFLKRFDLIVVFGRDGEGNLMRNLNRICQGRILHINPFSGLDERTHLVDHLLRQLYHFGFAASEGIPRIFLNESDRAWAKKYWVEKGADPGKRAGAIVLHPGSGSKKKVWPLDRFRDLLMFLQESVHSQFLIVLGPAEGPDVRKLFEVGGPNIAVLAEGLSLIQLASIMEGCRLFVGNDSGVSHLAAALGIPTLTIFGPTDPRIWSPRGERVVVVRRGTSCSPCSPGRFYECQHIECLKGVEMEDVLEGIRGLGLDNEMIRKEVKDGREEGR